MFLFDAFLIVFESFTKRYQNPNKIVASSSKTCPRRKTRGYCLLVIRIGTGRMHQILPQLLRSLVVEKDGENSQTKQVVHGGSVVFEPTLHISSLFLAKDKAAHSSHWTPDHMRCQVQLSHHVQGTIQGDTKIIHQCWCEYAGGRFSMLCTWQAGFDSCNAGTTYMMNAKASLLVD